MDEDRVNNEVTQQDNRDRWAEIRAQVNRPLLVAIATLLVIVGITAAYGIHQQALVKQLSAQSTTSAAATNQLQIQVNTLSAQLKAMSEAAQSSKQTTVTGIPEETEAEAPATTPAPVTVAEAPISPAPKHVPAKRHAGKTPNGGG